MATMFKLVPADPVSGFDQHIEEFREYFQSRGVSFGSAADLPAFVTRLATDARFRDDMASMVRTVIYRERDGVSRLELVEIVVVAVEGAQAEDADEPEVRDAERKVVAFVDGVFRTRWNPGESSVRGDAAKTSESEPDGSAESVEAATVNADEPEVESSVAAVLPVAEAAALPHSHATTDLFYRAQMVAGVEPAEAMAEERKAASAAQFVPEPRVDGPDDFTELETAEPSAAPAGYEAGRTQMYATEPVKTRKASRFWIWTAGVCALLLAFCAGLFVHQRLLVPLRDPNQPYEQPPADTAPEVTPAQATGAGRVESPSVGRERRAEARERESVRRSRAELAAPVSRAAVVSAPVPRTVVAAAPAKPVEPTGRTNPAEGNAASDAGVPSTDETANLQPRYMAPAMIGASPALMASHLMYAPAAGYPLLAEMGRIQGRVLVEAVVAKSGRVIRAQAISGHRLLRGAAVREVYERRYKPYLLDGRPTDVATIVSVDFRLK